MGYWPRVAAPMIVLSRIMDGVVKGPWSDWLSIIGGTVITGSPGTVSDTMPRAEAAYAAEGVKQVLSLIFP